MEYRHINNKADYDYAIAQVDELFSLEESESTSLALDIWAMLIEQYEDVHYPMDDPDPISAIAFRMDQMNLKQKDVADYFGSKTRVSEVLSYKRELTKKMIQKISTGLDIPMDLLMKPYDIKTKAVVSGSQPKKTTYNKETCCV